MNIEILKDLREEILKLFPKTEPPRFDEITAHRGCCEDGDDLVNGFSGVKWWEIKRETIDDNHGNLPLFTDEAYHYYFPAFLLNALDDFTGYNEVLQFLIFDLEPPKDKRDVNNKAYIKRRSQLFSLDQAKIIVNFLEMILKVEDEQMRYYHEDAKRALKFWKSRQFAVNEEQMS